VRGVLVEALRGLGCDVTEAATGAAALQLVAQQRPDVVCLDLWMDGMTGLEVLDRLTRDYPGVPVVIVTADPVSDTMREAQARGAVAYVAKPFKLGQLRSAVAAALRGAGR
jgi:CheY-like chemotaxis protein